MTTSPEISVVAPCYNEEAGIAEFVRRTATALCQLEISHEIVLVDDGSRDRTLDVVRELLPQYPQLRVIELSRNFGHQAAVTAGMDAARGRAVVLMDSDLQDPPEAIAEMIALWRQGNDVVYARRRRREGETLFKIYTAKLFYRALRLFTNVNIPLDAGDFRLMDRRVVDALGRMREHHRFIRGMVSWVGFRQAAIVYDRKSRYAGTPSYSLSKMISLSLDAVTAFSLRPVRMLSFLGLAITVLAIVGAICAAVRGPFLPWTASPGVQAIFLLVMFLGGLNLFGLGVVGEYVGRNLEESQDRPIYVVRNEFPK